MKKHFILTLATATLLTTAIAHADPYVTQDGFEKIKTNLENAKVNQKEYDKNLSTVSKNLDEINKARSTVLKQKEGVSGEIVQNNESLKKVVLQEREIAQLMAQEKQKFETESKQIEQLTALITQIKQNQTQREALIADYQNQLGQNQEEKKAWKARETELRAQEGKTINSLRGLATEESTWSNKKKGYEIEVKRWSAEADKQQKIHDTYQGLKESK